MESIQMRIAICDDEALFLRKEEQFVSDILSDKGIDYCIDTFCTDQEVMELEKRIYQYIVILLDVNMENVNGIEIARKIREHNKEIYIAFVTAYIDYALEGYKLDAIRYLLKGDDMYFREELSECFEAVLERRQYKEDKKKFKFIEGARSVFLNDIVYIESQLHKLKFFMKDNNIYTQYGTLNNLESEIKEFGFLRVHQSYLVNLEHIKNIHKNHILVTGDTDIIIPRSRYRAVKDAIISYKGDM